MLVGREQSNSRVACPSGLGIHEDTLGGTVKAGMAQLLSLELVRGNGKDNRCILRYMPWLFNPPSAIQQGYGHVFNGCIDYFLNETVNFGQTPRILGMRLARSAALLALAGSAAAHGVVEQQQQPCPADWNQFQRLYAHSVRRFVSRG